MGASRYRVSRLRAEIEKERKRQQKVQKILGSKAKSYEMCKESSVSKSKIRVATDLSHKRRLQQKEIDWKATYELNRGDWESPVQVEISCHRQHLLDTQEGRQAAKKIAKWMHKSFERARRLATAMTRPETGPKPSLVDPNDILARITRQIEEKAAHQRRNRAAYVVQRFFNFVLDTRCTDPDIAHQNKTQRIFLRRQARKRLADEKLKLEWAARRIQATFRGSRARKRFTWRQSLVKHHFMQVLILEAEWQMQPSAAILLQLAQAYWTYSHDLTYSEDQRHRILRAHVLFSVKALSYGWRPAQEDASQWFATLGHWFYLLWVQQPDDTAMLHEAFRSLDTALSLGLQDPDAHYDYCRVLASLGLFCHVVRACSSAALDLLDDSAKRWTTWRLRAVAHWHLNEYTDAARFLTMCASNLVEDSLYSTLDLWLLLARCHAFANEDSTAATYLEKILTSLYTAEDIVRRELSVRDVAMDATLHFSVASKCFDARDLSFSSALLDHALQCASPGAVLPEHLKMAEVCANWTTTRAQLDVQSRAIFETQKRLAVARVREELIIEL